MVGWLTVDGTSIDYPVMQGGNNLTFLNRNPYGEFSLSGSIFLDSRNSPDFSDEYSIIYGHHMAYGKLFGALDAFLDETYTSSHRSRTLLIGRDGQKSAGLRCLPCCARMFIMRIYSAWSIPKKRWHTSRLTRK